jgi:beta-fructofuranosidase
MPKIVFQPDGYTIGDAMPFYEDGIFYFYHYKTAVQKDPASNADDGLNWTLSTTKDFVSYKDHGELFKHGAKDEQDVELRSGTLLKAKDGVYHFFYAGFNKTECALHASGRDIAHLVKDDFRLPAPQGYDSGEFRDPYIMWCDELNAYIMLIGTRKANGKYQNGCTVWYTSTNLKAWEFKGDFWAPDQYTTHEMPDLFKIGPWWYLLVSEYSDSTQVIYRRSKSIKGPWEIIGDGVLDGPAYFAGRSCADEQGNRYLAGWIAGKVPEGDRSPWGSSSGQWVHRICQKEDGSLGTSLPDSVYRVFSEKKLHIDGPVTINAPSGRKEVTLCLNRGNTFLIEAVIEAETGTYAFSVNILENESTGEAYEYRFIIGENRIMLNRTPNHGIEPPDHFRGPEKLYRTAPLAGKKEFHIQIIYDDSYVILYSDGIALSGRLYSPMGDTISAAAFNGSITIKDFTLKELQHGI